MGEHEGERDGDHHETRSADDQKPTKTTVKHGFPPLG
jgi:very-short-patch-repair endonuclease